MVWDVPGNNSRYVIYDTNINLVMEKPALVLEILMHFYITGVTSLQMRVIDNSDSSLKTENWVSINDLFANTFFISFKQRLELFLKNLNLGHLFITKDIITKDTNHT